MIQFNGKVFFNSSFFILFFKKIQNLVNLLYIYTICIDLHGT